MNDELPAIPLVNPLLPTECSRSASQCVDSSFIGPGRLTHAFEREVSRICGTAEAVATVSGTASLSVAAIALGLRPGDRIAVPAYGVISVANGFGSAGFTPVPIDIEIGSATIDPVALESALARGEGIKAVCLVDFSGYVGPVTQDVMRTCHAYGLPVIEDAACALGNVYGSLVAGAVGTISTTSFSVPKIVTTGQGGAVMSNDPDLIAAARAWVDQGDLTWRETGLNHGVGTNLRFTDLQASIGLPQFAQIADSQSRKARFHSALQTATDGRLWDTPGDSAPLHNIVFSETPTDLVAALRRYGIAAACQYTTLTRHPAYSTCSREDFTNADWWADRAVYLPFGAGLSVEDAMRIGAAIHRSGDPLIEPPDAPRDSRQG